MALSRAAHWRLPLETLPMVLIYFSPYIFCIPYGIQLLPSCPSPSSLLLPYPTNHHIGGTRAKSEPSKHLSSLNVRQRLVMIWMGASLRSSTPPSSSRSSRSPARIRYTSYLLLQLLSCFGLTLDNSRFSLVDSMWKESSMERGYDCQGGSATVGGHDVKEYQLSVHSPLLSSFSPSYPALSLLSHSLTLGIVYILLIDRARGTRASAVWHDDPREHHVGILPQIIDATSMASIHKFISSLPNGLNTRVGGQGELAVLWTETKNCHRMYLFFSCIFFCDFRFSISIFDF